jgi:hypothetical protein
MVKHLMLDFMIPEPAAFYLFSKIHKKSVGLVKEQPLPPMVL